MLLIPHHSDERSVKLKYHSMYRFSFRKISAKRIIFSFLFEGNFPSISHRIKNKLIDGREKKQIVKLIQQVFEVISLIIIKLFNAQKRSNDCAFLKLNAQQWQCIQVYTSKTIASHYLCEMKLLKHHDYVGSLLYGWSSFHSKSPANFFNNHFCNVFVWLFIGTCETEKLNDEFSGNLTEKRNTAVNHPHSLTHSAVHEFICKNSSQSCILYTMHLFEIQDI